MGEHMPGTLRIWTGTAEELVGAKAYYIRAGLFKDADIALFTHVGENLSVSWGQGTGTGLVSVQYSFLGETAHAAGAPWRGRSALDAVELMDIGGASAAPAPQPALARRHHRRRRSAGIVP
jgi:aminobenzoyl-glutamate utilization protein B